MRTLVATFAAISIATVVSSISAGERVFDLDLETVSLEPRTQSDSSSRSDALTEARRALWDDPMTRWTYQLQQQQAWVMRGTAPGSDRMTGAVVSVKAQGGLPLHLVASSQLAGSDLSEQRITMVRWPWEEQESPPVMSLEDQLAVLLGERLEQEKERDRD